MSLSGSAAWLLLLLACQALCGSYCAAPAGDIGWPMFADHTHESPTATFAENWDVLKHLRPSTSRREAHSLVDLNGDGLLDLVHSQDALSSFPGTHWYINSGTAARANFSLLSTAETWFSALPIGEASATSFGDLDGNGQPDLFLTKWKFNSVDNVRDPTVIFVQNRGSPDLTPGALPVLPVEAAMNAFLAALGKPGYVEPCDWDNDGDDDLIVVPYPLTGTAASSQLLWFENRGSPSLPSFNATSPDFTFTVPGVVLSVQAGDFNKDLLLDLLVGTVANKVMVFAQDLPDTPITGAAPFMNLSSLAFTENKIMLANHDLGSGYHFVAIGDIDGDSDQDIVLGVDSTNGVATRLFRNLGRVGKPKFLVNGTDCGDLCSANLLNSARISLADLDSNGEEDIIALDLAGHFRAFMRQGRQFNAPADVWDTPLRHVMVDPRMRYQFIDITADGLVDIVGMWYGVSDAVVVHTNVGTSTSPQFALDIVQPLASGTSLSTFPGVYVLDVDGDGLLDILLATGQGILNTGTASAPAFTGTLVTDPAGAFLSQLLADATIAGSAYTGEFFDVDGDGDLDFLHGLTDGKLTLMKNAGGFVFTEDGSNPFSSDLVQGAPSAFDMYSHGPATDLVPAAQAHAVGLPIIEVGVYNRTGNTFHWNHSITYSTTCKADFHIDVQLVDMDGDGTVEVVLLCAPKDMSSWSRPHVWMFTMNFTSGEYYQTPDGTMPWGAASLGPRGNFACGDMDADGDVDFIITDESLSMYVENLQTDTNPLLRRVGARVTVDPSAGPYTFYNSLSYATPYLGDMNGDGLLDLAHGYSREGLSTNWRMILNSGTATSMKFDAASEQWTVGTVPGGIIQPRPFIVDLNGDSQPEVVALNENGRANVWSLDFTFATEFSTNAELSSAISDVQGLPRAHGVPVDIDSDGDIDLLYASSKGVHVIANVARDCFSACSGHGVCVDSTALTVLGAIGTCSCSHPFRGEFCDQCVDGVYGVRCHKSCPLSRGGVVCGGEGTCDSGKYGTGRCTCNEGYSGDDCGLGGCIAGTGYDDTSRSCVACTAGHFKAYNLNSPCLQCAPGTFTNDTSAKECEKCGLGMYTALSGAIECTPCEVGHYSDEEGQFACPFCAAGSFSNTTGLHNCFPCGLGTATSCKGAEQCTDCEPGHYANVTGMSSCSACGVGMFQDEYGASGCKACGQGTFNNAKGQPKCFDCALGHFMNVTGSTSCSRCQPGSFANATGMDFCFECGPGTYTASYGQERCLPCPAGTFFNSTGATGCEPCPPGTHSQRGAAECIPCQRGEVQPAGTSDCLQCAKGSYSWIPGETISPDCHECPDGAYCPGGDVVVARKGYWRSSASSTLFHACPNEEACIGYAGDFRRLAEIASLEDCQEGYTGPLCHVCEHRWARAGPGECKPCRDDVKLWIGVAMGIGVLVVVVLVARQIWTSHKLQSQLMEQHLQREKESARVGADAPRLKLHDDAEQGIEAAIIKVVLSNLQVLAMAASFELSWPRWIMTIFEIQNAGSSVSGSVISLDCVFDNTHTFPTVFKIVASFAALPLVFTLLAAIVWFLLHPIVTAGRVKKFQAEHRRALGAARGMKRQATGLKRMEFAWERDPKGHRRDGFIISVIVIFFLLQSTVLKMCFDVFACKEVDPEVHVLIADMSYRCYTDEHWMWMLSLGLGMIVVYAVGVPALAFTVLFMRRHLLDTPQVLAKFAFITKGYEPEYWYWEIVVMLRKIGMLVCVTFLGRIDVELQTLVGLLILGVALVVQAYLKPFESDTLDRLEFLGLCVAVATLHGGMLLFTGNLHFVVSQGITLAIAVLNAAYLLYGLKKILDQLRSRAGACAAKTCGCCSRKKDVVAIHPATSGRSSPHTRASTDDMDMVALGHDRSLPDADGYKAWTGVSARGASKNMLGAEDLILENTVSPRGSSSVDSGDDQLRSDVMEMFGSSHQLVESGADFKEPA